MIRILLTCYVSCMFLLFPDYGIGAIENTDYIFSCGELDWYLYTNKNSDTFKRDIVLPRGGPYKVIKQNDSELNRYHSSEAEFLRKLVEMKVPGIAQVPGLVHILIQETKSPKEHPFVEGICLSMDDGPVLPWLSRTYSIPLRIDVMSIFQSFSHLNHLEMFDFEIGNNTEYFSPISKMNTLQYLGLPYDSKDHHLEYLKSLTKLEFINLSGTMINGSGLEAIALLPKLNTLDLRYTNILPGKLLSLIPATTLETLLLSGSSVQDSDIHLLKEIPAMKYLTLHNTSITDAGLEDLALCKQLKYVSLHNTKTSDSKRRWLRTVRPDMTIQDIPFPSYESVSDFKQRLAGYLGDSRIQFGLASAYETGRNTTPKNTVEALTWYMILQCNHSWHARTISQLSMADLDKIIKRMMEQLDANQIHEAQIRVELARFIAQQTNICFTVPHQEGLPIYQYEIMN